MSFDADDAHGSVTIDRVEPRVVEGSVAAVSFAAFVCHVDPTEGIGAIGSVFQRDIDDSRTSLLAATARRRGSVVVDGIDVTYAHDHQHGTQRLGGVLDLRVVRDR